MTERTIRRQRFRTAKLLEAECSQILQTLIGLNNDHKTGVVILSMCASLLTMLGELPEAHRPLELKQFMRELDKFSTWWGARVFESTLDASTVNPASPDGSPRTKKRS